MLETPRLGGQSLVYMYGLSDFWVDMFKDNQLIETLLEGQTIQLAEAYSYFLQRSAGISLADIQDRYSTRIKLLLISEDDIVTEGDYTSFKIDSSILNVSKLSNRPILPTSTLTYGVHFDIDDSVIKFHKPIGELKFPVRYKADGTWQYAIWMSDVEINDKWIDNTFGRLVGFTEDDAIFNYKSFLEGVYFLYTNGPNISNIERGVNLAMGMPYARETEEVLDVAQDEVSGNWIVLTSNYSYEIPYAYQPDISIGDTLVENNVLSTWVDIRDYTTSGAWWYQVYLPREVLGKNVDPYELGLAKEGSTADTMMNNFLKHHMFEVLITQPSSDETAYNTARNLVLRSKPEYTYPVFVWKASIGDEFIEMEDDLTYNYGSELTDTCVSPPSIRFMDRSDEETRFSRGISWYNRVQGPMYVATLLGVGDWPDNGGWAPQFENISERYKTYMAVTVRNRGDRVSSSNRNTVLRGWRGVDNENFDGLKWEVKAADVYGGDSDMLICERNTTPLYLMNAEELIAKMKTVDSRFTIGKRTRIVVTGLNLVSVYNTWMKRNVGITSNFEDTFNFVNSSADLDNAFSSFAYQTFVPRLSDMYDENNLPITDGTILITRTTDTAWSCQWVRTRVSIAPTLFPIEDMDHTRAIQNYSSERLGQDYMDNGLLINEGVTRIVNTKLINDTNECIVVVDGLYQPINQYTVEVEKSRAEITTYEPEDPNYTELEVDDRSYIVLPESPSYLGYVAYDTPSELPISEETLSIEMDDTYILSQTVSKEDILVIHNGKFIFDFIVVDDILIIERVTEEVTVRYVSHTLEEVLPSGSDSYELSQDTYCKLFIGDELLEDWAFTRIGTSIYLPAVTVSDIVVRYEPTVKDTRLSNFSRSTVETTQARFLMDRRRENGEYSDYLGNTVFMDRSGIPKDSSGNNTESINVIRRLM